MSSERSTFAHKEFQSLQHKQRHKLGMGRNGVIPINTLASDSSDIKSKSKSPVRITIPTTNTNIITNNDFSNHTAEARLLREELDSMDSSSSVRNQPHTLHSKIDIRERYHTVFNDTVDIHKVESDTIKPKCSIDLESLKINNNSPLENGQNTLQLHISYNDDYIYFTNFNKIIDNSIIPKKGYLKSAIFSKLSIIFEMKGFKGFIVAKPLNSHIPLREYFRHSSEWGIDVNILSQKMVDKIIVQLAQACQFPDSTLFKSTTRLDSLAASEFFSPRSTRSKTRDLEFNFLGKSSKDPINIIPDSQNSFNGLNIKDSNSTTGYRTRNRRINYAENLDDEVLVRETPAPFSPDLKYKFAHNKIVTITYSDFKTLYNNDWINDSVIDFFIQYEIDKAIHQYKVLGSEEIYALNSFFFTKLMSKSDSESTPNYYANIKRWLIKLDLMKYPYVILPINENAHWYCCIIKGLPQLLEQGLNEKAAKEKAANEEADRFTFENNSNNTTTPETITEIDDEIIDSPEKGSSTSPPLKKPRHYQTEIFVFDSLAQTHSNINVPLKRFIIDYCKDKYDIDLQKHQIRVFNARVPKQSNFNDCGIHVIYNFKKWLYNIADCERMWRGSYNMQQARSLFVAEERDSTRKQLIDILLKLHKEQESTQFDNSHVGESDVAESEDDLEVIECTPESESKKEVSEIDPKSEKSEPQRDITNESVTEIDHVSEQVRENDTTHNKSKHRTEPELEHEIGAVPEPEPDPESEPDPNPNPNPKPEVESEVETERESESQLKGLSEDANTTIDLSPVSYPKTLDPRAQLDKLFINKALNQRYEGKPINEHVVTLLNALYDKKNIEPQATELELIANLIEEVPSYESDKDEVVSKIRDFQTQLEALPKQSVNSLRPRHQEFRIDPNGIPSDLTTSQYDSDEVNESVSRLRISQITKSPKSPISKSPSIPLNTKLSSPSTRASTIPGEQYFITDNSDVKVISEDTFKKSETSPIRSRPKRRRLQ
ncbi:uncharacterized protein RJT21DRAFT_44540 [Scheffersomyces amazonensis]|uniref:uncharacterized protein n=1 Tax=Scheffersomyces amazonensis TaxID=1078765 RepID=UPI00315C9ABE